MNHLIHQVALLSKEILRISVAYTLTCGMALGQAGIYFRNQIPGQVGAVDAPFFDDDGLLLAGTNYVAQLYAWKTGVGFLSTGTPVPFETNGFFYGDTIVVEFLLGCLPAWVQVRAWNTQGGGTFEQAALAGAWTGVSEALFLLQTGTPDRPEACPLARLTGLTYPGPPIFVRQPQNQTVLARSSRGEGEGFLVAVPRSAQALIGFGAAVFRGAVTAVSP